MNWQTEPKKEWSTLNALFEAKFIDPVDLIFSTCFFSSEEEVAFSCHLFRQARLGSIAVKLDHEKILPDPKESWTTLRKRKEEEKEIEVSEDIWKKLCELILKGKEKAIHHPGSPFTSKNSYFYLKKFYHYESLFLTHVKRLEKSKPDLDVEEEKFKSLLHNLIKENKLTKSQAEAILASSKNTLTVIQGGPGTGKTYTAGYLLRIFWQSLDEEKKKRCQISIVAPTGKAASQIEMSLKKVLHDFDFPKLRAKTLHRLLKISSSWQKIEFSETLEEDILLVDESSMIDLFLMTALFSSVKEGSRLILLGDPDQLPPVEAGTPFFDLTECLKKTSPEKVVTLDKSLRVENNSLLQFQETIRKGNWEKKNSPNLLFHDLKIESFSSWIDRYVPFFMKDQEEDPESVFRHFQTFRILSPFRKGLFGSLSFNQVFYEACLKKRKKENHYIPILIQETEEKKNIYNGDTAVFVEKKEDRFALFQEGNSFRKLSSFLLPSYSFAYCLSVHKSQGSEFDHVVLFLPEGSEVFGKEMLYTAATRAKKKLEIVAKEETLEKLMAKKTFRLSQIAERFLEG